MLATYRDSPRELNQGDLRLLETRLETRLIVLAEKLETRLLRLESSVVTKRWELETSIIRNNSDLVPWMLVFFVANVVWTAILLAGAIRL